MSIGAVVIGRNEGERLAVCLRSLAGRVTPLVYVDSGSTDGSIAIAESSGAAVVCLDLSLPFTAARARNTGLARLRAIAPEITFVQFVDGDCEVVPGWLDRAPAFLDSRPDVAVVCGRLRERFPERSIYNRLCDLEWAAPPGQALACGGIALMRVAALEQVGGFRANLIAGEEPELCFRLRALGWVVWCLDHEMAVHDAAMTKFSQWWRRCMRAGHAFAEGAALHGASPERHWVREARSARLWALGIPFVVLVALLVLGPLAAWALLVYPLQVARLALRSTAPPHRWAGAFFLVLGKFPEAIGQLKYFWSRASGSRPRLIEHK